MFNLATDEEHVSLGFGVSWIRELSTHFDRIDVVTMYEGRHRLPANVSVWSLGHERGYSKARRAARFYRTLREILRRRRPHVTFTHMVHGLAVLFLPVARVTGVRNLLWYAHRAVPFGLRLAHLAADRVVSSTPEGFRLPSGKVRFIGQGVDLDLIAIPADRGEGRLQLITVGRVSPSKRLDLVLEALEAWGGEGAGEWELDLVGGPATPSERLYDERLAARVRSMRFGERIRLRGRLSPQEIACLLSRADIFVSMGETGSLDKAIVEAMAAGCVVLSSNEAFRRIAGESGFADCGVRPCAEDLAEALARTARMAPEDRRRKAQAMRTVAVRDHSLHGLIGRLVDELRELASEKGGPA